MTSEWATTPAKQHIIPWLDYGSRCNLRLCSKSDRSLVDSIPFVAHSIEISERIGELSPEKSTIRVNIDTFTIWFIGKDNVTKVDRAWNGELQTEMSEIKQENRYEVTSRFFDRLKTFNARVVSIFRVEMMPSEKWSIKCDELVLQIMGGPPGWAVAWLGRVESKLEKLCIYSWNLDGIGPVLQNLQVTKKLQLTEESDVTYEHLEHIESPYMNISSREISIEGIRKMLMKFLKYGKKKDDLIIHTEFPEDFDVKTSILSDLIYTDEGGSIPAEHNYRITGGFENVHGFYTPREFCYFANSISAYIRFDNTEKCKRRHMLWPFSRYDT